MNEPHENINQDSGKTEYGTLPGILREVKEFLGGIELDPASSAEHNKIVMANRFFSLKDQDWYLARPWEAKTLFMNPPFGSRIKNGCVDWEAKAMIKGYPPSVGYIPGIAEWVSKLLYEHRVGNVKEAICITFASTSEGWFQPLLKHPQCFLSPRTNYMVDGKIKKGVSKGSVLTYLGDRKLSFLEHFSALGVCK